MTKLICFLTMVLALNVASAQEIGSPKGGKEPGVAKQGEHTRTDASLSEVTGVVRERGTRVPLKNITFFIKEKQMSVQTDENGRFEFSIAPGTYSVIIPVAGYRKLEAEIEVRADEILQLTFRADPLTMNSYQIVVRGKKDKSAVSAQRISTEEVASIPGSNHDVLSAVSNLPGVNSVTVFGGYVNVSLLSSSFLLEGPLSENDSLAVSGKRGFLDQYVRLAEQVEPDPREEVAFTRYPTYYDGSFIYNHDISGGNAIKLYGYGGSDTTEIITAEEPESGRFSNKISLDQAFLNLAGEWHLKEGAFKSVFSPRFGRNTIHYDFGPRAFFDLKWNQLSLSEKLEYRFNKAHRLKAGGRLDYGSVDFESSWFTGPKEGEIGYNPYEKEIDAQKTYYFVTPSIYGMDEMTYGRFIIAPGFFALYDTHNENYYIDPRLSAKYKLTDSSTLKAAAGMYSKTPPAESDTETSYCLKRI